MNKTIYNIPPFMDIDFMLCTLKTNFNREETYLWITMLDILTTDVDWPALRVSTM